MGAVHLQVSDLQRSTSYYETVLGFRKTSATTNAEVLSAHAGGPPLLHLRTEPGVIPSRRGTFGLFHFAILLPDRVALARFAAHVSRLGVPVAMADHHVSEAFYLHDPDGLGVEVYADRPRERWQFQDRELRMTTEPLDVEDLLAAAGDEAWNGAPEGTTMGHVHLNVGSLDAGEAFYHRALGFDKTVWGYRGALFLSAGGYHHHLAVNTWSSGPSPREEEARLLWWELVVPEGTDVSAAGQSLRAAGFGAQEAEGGTCAADPWGTRVFVRASK